MSKYDYTKLKALREKKELTQKQVGEILGITQSAYNKLETGNRKRKSDSVIDIEKLAEAFELTPPRLISILTNQNDIVASGIKEADLWQVHKVLKENPLREDEFVLFTTNLLDPDKYGFKKNYKRFDDSNMEDMVPFPMWEYPPPVHIIIADTVELGFEYKDKKLTAVAIWLANKKLGVIPDHLKDLVNHLVIELMISRVLLIENEDSIPGYVDHYMKVVFIASNAVCKSSEFKKGRFSTIRLMTEEEVKKAEETDLDNIEKDED